MVHHDFSVLKLSHPRHLIRDTAKSPYARVLAGFSSRQAVSLRSLTLSLFGTHIQTGEHCSVEDARASMAIYRLVERDWEADLKRSNSCKRKVPPSDFAYFSESTFDILQISCSKKLRKVWPTCSPWLQPLSPVPCDNPCSELPASTCSLLADDFWPESVD
ncbi:unnamed protein product [Dicrocoelium dendriticum]|nr:unnamed protein product [Dicrocoelium dendriticum]